LKQHEGRRERDVQFAEGLDRPSAAAARTAVRSAQQVLHLIVGDVAAFPRVELLDHGKMLGVFRDQGVAALAFNRLALHRSP